MNVEPDHAAEMTGLSRKMPPTSGGLGNMSGPRPGDLTDLAASLLADLTRDREIAAWVLERADEVRREHGGDQIALLKAAVACLAEEVARLEAELASEA